LPEQPDIYATGSKISLTATGKVTKNPEKHTVVVNRFFFVKPGSPGYGEK